MDQFKYHQIMNFKYVAHKHVVSCRTLTVNDVLFFRQAVAMLLLLLLLLLRMMMMMKSSR